MIEKMRRVCQVHHSARDRKHRVQKIGREHRRHRERHHERRNRQRDIGKAHDHDLHPAAEIPGEKSKRRAYRDGEPQNDRREQQRNPVAKQDPAEDVATHIVGAEPVLRRGRLVSDAKIDDCADVVGMRSDPWREQRRKDDDGHDCGAD